MERFSLLQLVIPNRILKKCPPERGTNSHSAEGQEYWTPKSSILAKGEIIEKLNDDTKKPYRHTQEKYRTHNIRLNPSKHGTNTSSANAEG